MLQSRDRRGWRTNAFHRESSPRRFGLTPGRRQFLNLLSAFGRDCEFHKIAAPAAAEPSRNRPAATAGDFARASCDPSPANRSIPPCSNCPGNSMPPGSIPCVGRIPCRRISASKNCVTFRVTQRKLKHTQFSIADISSSLDMMCICTTWAQLSTPFLFLIFQRLGRGQKVP